MRISNLLAWAFLLWGVLLLFQCSSDNKIPGDLMITYPFDNSVFPKDIISPNFRWQTNSENIDRWRITVSSAGSDMFTDETRVGFWRPDAKQWKLMRARTDSEIRITVEGVKDKPVCRGQVSIFISGDEVKAPVFFRAVPLPFKFARENLKRIRWHLGSVSEESQPHVVLENIPVCANCHSFTPQGNNIAMDVDARDDKGAYVITKVDEKISFPEDSIIHWSDFQEGKFTYGLLSQISPDGRYVVSTLRDCEIFADRKDLEYSQLFFPFKGILVVYDRSENRYFELEGANDTTLVQSNPIWTPDGKYIYFTRTKAKQFEESGIHNGSVPEAIDKEQYHKFLKSYMDRDSLIKFDIYKISFNEGKGGVAVPVEGASNNGMSNYFPKISPDGKWLVYCQAESFMLLQKDSKLNIIPAEGGKSRRLNANTSNMNSWHSWSPNSKWLVFSTKMLSPYTQLFLTHIDENGNDSPPVYLENFSFDNYAANIPEFVNIEYDKNIKITPSFLSENDFIIRNGEICLANDDLDGAFNYFNKAVELFPKQSEPYYRRGRIYYEKHNLSKAIADYDKAIGLEKRATYYTSRAIAMIKLNKYDEAEKDLNQAIKLDPTDHMPRTYLGILRYNTGKYDEAKNYLEKSIELFNGDSYTYYYYGLLNYTLGNLDQANSALTKTIELKPSGGIEPLVYELRANVRFEQRDYVGVLNDLKYAINFCPNDPKLYLLKGKAELKNGILVEAKRSFLQSQKLGGKEAAAYLKEIPANI